MLGQRPGGIRLWRGGPLLVAGGWALALVAPAWGQLPPGPTSVWPEAAAAAASGSGPGAGAASLWSGPQPAKTSAFAAGPDLPGAAPRYSGPAAEYLPAGFPRELEEGLAEPPASGTGRRRGAKPGPLQGVALRETWLPRGETGLGLHSQALDVVLAVPFPTAESPLVVSPRLEITEVDGPRVGDLPPRLYDASLELRWLPMWTPGLGLDLAVAPGWHGDYQETVGEVVRIPARALAVIESSPELKLIVGVMYLDREDVNWLPAGGLLWTPDEDHRLELIFPRPKYAWRFLADGQVEQWWYVAGEFGGGSYAIRRASGESDVATLSDVRLIYGLEHRRLDGLAWNFEFAYVLARELEYASGTPDFEPDDTALLRAGVTW
jgi:hypothetical protein